MNTNYTGHMADDSDTMHQARRITTGTDNFTPGEEETDPLDPSNLSPMEILDYMNDQDWMDEYGDRIPDWYWRIIDEMFSGKKEQGNGSKE